MKRAPATEHRGRRTLFGLLVMGLLGALTGFGTHAAFTGASTNPNNRFATGTVLIADDDAESVLFSLAGMKPGDPATVRCIGVTYMGSVEANVRLYAAVSGTLAPYLDLTVTRGTADAGDAGCATFVADGTDYLGQGSGVVYAGTLGTYPASYDAGSADPPSGAPEIWSQGETHAYRFAVTVQDVPGSMGASATAELIWEARNTE